MIKSTLIEALNGVWPMIAIFTVILASFRITYLIYKKEKFVLYKELSSLIFLIYILVLFYLVTYQESNYGTSNYTPFKEIFRYDIGSSLFFRNIIGNILLFLPLGLFLTSYINTRKLIPIFLLTTICSLAIELTQKAIGRVFDIDDIILNVIGGIFGYIIWILLDSIKKKLPSVFQKEWFSNVIMIIVEILIVLYFTEWHTYLVGMVT
jgi:glycopeptide antibiotics resistance protein